MRKGDILRTEAWLPHEQLAATPFLRTLVISTMRTLNRKLNEYGAGQVGPTRSRIRVDAQRTRITLEATFL